ALVARGRALRRLPRRLPRRRDPARRAAPPRRADAGGAQLPAASRRTGDRPADRVLVRRERRLPPDRRVLAVPRLLRPRARPPRWGREAPEGLLDDARGTPSACLTQQEHRGVRNPPDRVLILHGTR